MRTYFMFQAAGLALCCEPHRVDRLWVISQSRQDSTTNSGRRKSGYEPINAALRGFIGRTSGSVWPRRPRMRLPCHAPIACRRRARRPIMKLLRLVLVFTLLFAIPALPQQRGSLQQLLEAEVVRMPARVGLYVKH